MNEKTLLFRRRIRNSSSGGLRPSTLPLGHGGSPQYWIFTSQQGRNILFIRRSEWISNRNLWLSKQAVLPTAPRPPTSVVKIAYINLNNLRLNICKYWWLNTYFIPNNSYCLLTNLLIKQIKNDYSRAYRLMCPTHCLFGQLCESDSEMSVPLNIDIVMACEAEYNITLYPLPCQELHPNAVIKKKNCDWELTWQSCFRLHYLRWNICNRRKY